MKYIKSWPEVWKPESTHYQEERWYETLLAGAGTGLLVGAFLALAVMFS